MDHLKRRVVKKLERPVPGQFRNPPFAPQGRLNPRVVSGYSVHVFGKDHCTSERKTIYLAPQTDLAESYGARAVGVATIENWMGGRRLRI